MPALLDPVLSSRSKGDKCCAVLWGGGVTPSQLDRAYRRVLFELDHQRNRYAWSRTDLERDVAAAVIRSIRERQLDLWSEITSLRLATAACCSQGPVNLPD